MAGCVPIDKQGRRVLLVASSKHDGEWVLPKGGWENDETQEEAAARETWEEGAGKNATIFLHTALILILAGLAILEHKEITILTQRFISLSSLRFRLCLP